jgi:hypothetical protein
MRKLLYVAVAVTLMCGCSGSTPEEQAAKAAKKYYDLLAKGKAIEFLEGKADVGDMPADYCEQLLKAVRQYGSDMKQKHQGLRRVEVSPNVARRDTTLRVTYAFLLLTFGDSTKEEITVPMVERDGQWLMR